MYTKIGLLLSDPAHKMFKSTLQCYPALIPTNQITIA